MRGYRLFLGFAVLFMGTVFARGVELRLEGDRLWLTAQNEPLAEVLTAFARLGVQVKMDPGLKNRLRVRVVDAPIERALSSVLEPNGYALIWDTLHGPLGPLVRLSEIHVFRPGHERAAVSLPSPLRNLRVVRGPDGQGPEFVADEILIGFAPGSSSDAIHQLLRELGGILVDGIPELGIYQIRFPPGSNVLALVEQLKNNPLVAAVEPNYAYRAPPSGLAEAGDAGAAVFPGVARTGTAPVAILDSGLQMMPGLESFIAGGLDALDPTRELVDTAGHGTQMALIATGAVAPAGETPMDEGLPILAIRAFDDNGVASNYGIMRSILFAQEQGARVLNMSWGSATSSDFLQNAVSYAKRQDMVLVAAAGNEPTGQAMYPAAYTGVIGVGALDKSGKVWTSSNYGDSVFLAAPGIASFPVGYEGPPGSYAGTSIASAYTTHAVGHYFGLHPKATERQAVTALRRAVAGEGTTRTRQTGYGVLDAAALKRFLE